ncbi:hypothetical protein L914_15978 [Phytophthora nicotianae]|uniref:Uncharacterized protein n=1 Tax=Phytophthora nicotianae TaxID=4792 RepID=W2MM92_PHYNI|nr:hypothetical protein L914_15978 [Phytophthora nicotianae]
MKTVALKCSTCGLHITGNPVCEMWRAAVGDARVTRHNAVWQVLTGNSCTSLGVVVSEFTGEAHATEEPTCVCIVDNERTQVVYVPAQDQVDPVGQHRVLLLYQLLRSSDSGRRSAALWSDDPPHGRAR